MGTQAGGRGRDSAERGVPDPRRERDWEGRQGVGDPEGRRGGGFRPEEVERVAGGAQGGVGWGRTQLTP